MDDITIQPITSEHLAQADGWPRSSSQTLLKQPGSDMVGSQLLGWTALKNSQVLAICQISFNKNEVGYLEVRVKPTAQRLGLGSKMTDYALTQPAVEAINHLHALVEIDSEAAQKILDGHRFSRVGYSADGRIEYARHP